jgi:hypothetical protein
MMGLGPYRPLRDLERALDGGNLKLAVAAAKDAARENGRPIPLELALRFLPLVAADDTSYDPWACRWLVRWLRETRQPSIEDTAELAACLAELPNDPQALNVILGMLRR